MIRLKYSIKDFLHLTIEDVHLDNPNTIAQEKHENYLRLLKNNLLLPLQGKKIKLNRHPTSLLHLLFEIIFFLTRRIC